MDLVAVARLVAAACVGLAPGMAVAQDCKLTVHASPRVVYAGGSASVNVLAEFPSTAYAFASAQFDVVSTHPALTLVTGGVVVGDDVMNIAAGQAHMPQQGVFANPANPYRVWRGVLTPTSEAPALVEVTADPQAFSIYPSVLTSSSVACEVESGSDLVFMNPVRVGKWLMAPRAGTRTTVSDDVIVDGRIITAENPEGGVRLGLLLPAVQAAREAARSSVGVGFDRTPDRFSFGVRLERTGGAPAPSETLQLNWAKIEYKRGTSAVVVSAGPGGGPQVRVKMYRNGHGVGSALVPRGEPGADWTIMLPSIPTRHSVEGGGLIYSGESGGLGAVFSLEYDEPVTALVRGVSGRVSSVVVDQIDVMMPVEVDGRAPTTGLMVGAMTFDAEGVERMWLRPGVDGR